MIRRHHTLHTPSIPAVLALALVASILTSCSAPPPAETLAALDLSLADTVHVGVPETIVVRAVGSRGSTPLADFEATVTITADREDIPPITLELSGGEGSAELVLLTEAGTVDLTAEVGAVRATVGIEVAFLDRLPGQPNDPAGPAIPEMPFLHQFVTYADGHPDIPDAILSTDTLGIAFSATATVAEANALLATAPFEIVGGIPGVTGRSLGLLIVRTTSDGHEEMTTLLNSLAAEPVVEEAVQDIVAYPDTVPDSNAGTPGSWTWTSPPAGGNWGLEGVRVPQMWNLNQAIEKWLDSGTARTVTGIVDLGFCKHPDLDYTESNCPDGTHGTAVAGIIGARWGNGEGIDGIAPYATLRTVAAPNTAFRYLSSLATLQAAGARVVNRSAGGQCDPAAPSCRAILDTHARRLVDQLGGYTSPPLLIDSAGNSASDARIDDQVAIAAFDLGLPNILIVENLAPPGTLAPTSNFGGHISAPGDGSISTRPSGYGSFGSTSAAAPHVAGVASYLFSLDPGLSAAQVRNLLIASRQSGAGGGAAAALDAFAAALAIDDLRGNDRILKMLLDIDDGTVDGNQRLVIGTRSHRTDSDGNGVADDALADLEELEFVTRLFEGEDADNDRGVGDGAIDMSDFRRWRDWLLQIDFGGSADLDGGTGHPKRDPNGNGIASEGSYENVFPRGDFNGDSVLAEGNPAGTSGPSDLDVLKRLFDDPDYTASDLDGLIRSADVTISPHLCFQLEAFTVTGVTSSIRLQGTDPDNILGSSRDHPIDEHLEVFTVATGQDYIARVEAEDASGDVVGVYDHDVQGLANGQDVLVDKCDPKPILTSVSGSPSTLPADRVTDATFTLPFEDAGANIEKIHGTFEFENNPTIFDLTWEHDEAFVSGFTNEKEGSGQITLEMVVYCSEKGTSTRVTATWRLEDEFEQMSDEESTTLTVDFSGCSNLRNQGHDSAPVGVRRATP